MHKHIFVCIKQEEKKLFSLLSAIVEIVENQEMHVKRRQTDKTKKDTTEYDEEKKIQRSQAI